MTDLAYVIRKSLLHNALHCQQTVRDAGAASDAQSVNPLVGLNGSQ